MTDNKKNNTLETGIKSLMSGFLAGLAFTFATGSENTNKNILMALLCGCASLFTARDVINTIKSSRSDNSKLR